MKMSGRMKAFMSVELTFGRSLIVAHPPGLDLRTEVILAAYGIRGEASQDRDLADVCERVGNRSLKQSLGFASERLLGELLVEPLPNAEESLDFPVPVDKVADVRQDL